MLARRAADLAGSGQVVELAVLDPLAERGDLGGGELGEAGRAVVRVAERDVAVLQLRHLDTVAVGAAVLALPPHAELVGVGQVLDREHAVLFSLSARALV